MKCGKYEVYEEIDVMFPWWAYSVHKDQFVRNRRNS